MFSAACEAVPARRALRPALIALQPNEAGQQSFECVCVDPASYIDHRSQPFGAQVAHPLQVGLGLRQVSASARLSGGASGPARAVARAPTSETKAASADKGTARPWRRALAELAALPFADRGPVLSLALARLAASCLSLTLCGFILRLLVITGYGHAAAPADPPCAGQSAPLVEISPHRIAARLGLAEQRLDLTEFGQLRGQRAHQDGAAVGIGGGQRRASLAGGEVLPGLVPPCSLGSRMPAETRSEDRFNALVGVLLKEDIAPAAQAHDVPLQADNVIDQHLVDEVLRVEIGQ